MITSDNAGKKFDGGKDPWHLLPWDAIRGVTKILAFGAAKYGERNWERGMNWSRLERAATEHLKVWFYGTWDDDGNWTRQDKDPETGRSHLLHAACCVLFMAAMEIRRVGKDDRPVYGPAAAPEAPLAGIPGWEPPLDVPKPLEPLTGVPADRDDYAWAAIEHLGRLQRPLEPEEIDPHLDRDPACITVGCGFPIDSPDVVLRTEAKMAEDFVRTPAKVAYDEAKAKNREAVVTQLLMEGRITPNEARQRLSQPDRPWCNGMDF